MYCILYTLVDLYVLYTVQFALVGTALQDRRNFIMTFKIGYTIPCLLEHRPCIYTFYKYMYSVLHGIHLLYIIWYAKALSTISFILKIPEKDCIPKELSLDHKLRFWILIFIKPRWNFIGVQHHISTIIRKFKIAEKTQFLS